MSISPVSTPSTTSTQQALDLTLLANIQTQQAQGMQLLASMTGAVTGSVIDASA